MSQSSIKSVQVLLAVILHLGNIEFKSDEDFGSVVTNTEALANAASLLSLEPEQLEKVLTKRVLASKKEQVYSNLSPSKAKYSRDALAKVCFLFVSDCTC